MANTKAAKKANRVSLRKRKFNLFRKSQVKNTNKALRSAISIGANIPEAVSKVFAALDKAAKGNTIPKGRADRKKSRIAKMVSKLMAGDAS